ncbi:MAG: tetraacyldisaccharide 4'-kinase [Gammaproteobacteria bacterium]|nr:tetraacyldisaccharide 4'-kinase [Gammaproteobacteria bacterium]NIM73872.1 tetraacyldisaccharide 4'-kinase [Gammaproteobacteria bacterium]NIN38060.1 tetraacyldisaccharide 4'-kinase [Gammaproteobacteria bacterium]NIO25653.1 tetraacyldisaccharide 4'-kinase [Gammaproteobacteria bacterium]NIO66287.1 tetraacyldisaccharide 4'-kinase [Gammaproteobacteria bacterium]
MSSRIDALWYENSPLSLALAPLGWLYCTGAVLRRAAYRIGLLPSRRVGAPVIVVGNISVGGTGKTPLVIWIARLLAGSGLRPGIVARGYRGRATSWPQQVRPDSDPVMVGDEPVLIARATGCPVAVDPDRVRAARALLSHVDCDVIISDDGLQHLALARDVEIAVVDGARRHGNGRCLPAGPLREPRSRLDSVDMVVANGGGLPGEFSMRVQMEDAENLLEASLRRPLADFKGGTVHAVCGIGAPERFFAALEGAGLTLIRHRFPDHHPFSASDIRFDDAAPVLMTEKDAVKCRRFADPRHWCVPVRAELPGAFTARLLRLLGVDAAPPPDP